MGVRLVVLVLLLASATPSYSETIRTALVIGVNRGSAKLGLPDLRHAESDAGRIAAQLERFGAFHPSNVVLLTGEDATREAIFAAAKRLGTESPGRPDSIFALFYTGHGVDGHLFTADPTETLTTADVDELLTLSGARLRIGFFDACFAGSLAPESGGALAKGPQVTPFNPTLEIPKVASGGQGQIIVASSRADQRSYEDPELGGLFSNYFVEAFHRTEPSLPAVKLNSLLDYAMTRTRAHARRLGRSQDPEVRIDASLDDPIFFSFPRARDATLALSPSVEGCVLTRYPRADLEERHRHGPGARSEVPIYSGQIEVEGCTLSDGLGSGETLTVGPGDTVEVARRDEPSLLRVWPGYMIESLLPKGLEDVEARATVARITLHGEAGYRFTPDIRPSWNAAHRIRPVHEARLGFWLDYGSYGVGAVSALGRSNREFKTWNYQVRSVDVRAALSWTAPIGLVALKLEATGGGRRSLLEAADSPTASATIDDETVGTFTNWSLVFGASAQLMVPLGGRTPAAYAALGLGADILTPWVGLHAWNEDYRGFGRSRELAPVVSLTVMSGSY